mgnify:CR=1 FL=1
MTTVSMSSSVEPGSGPVSVGTPSATAAAPQNRTEVEQTVPVCTDCGTERAEKDREQQSADAPEYPGKSEEETGDQADREWEMKPENVAKRVRAKPTPSGVPVAMTSPASRIPSELFSLAAFSAQRFSRRLDLALAPWRPAAFIAVIERPG